MIKSDQNNLLLVETIDSVDELNANFYGRFPYPWLASKFEYLHDLRFQTDMLNQAIGDWGHDVVPPDAKIWVAGCGVNQAVFTALKFPQASVVGSDVSSTSLELCTETARQLGIKNLELRQESLNHVTYQGEFDHVICTGVIHHNADPQATLEKLSQAMKPTGVMELMVYNRFHWVIPVAFQQAVRTLCSSQDELNFETELSVTRRIIEDVPKGIMLSRYLSRYNSASPEAMIADELLQPVIYSYTVESLEDMAAKCQLEMLMPCLNQFDKETGNFSWNMNFSDPVLRDLYESLPDTRRWHIANLFLMESSPMLWFYMQRTDGGRPRKTERVICEEFLDTVFARSSTTQKYFLRDEEEKYRLSPNEMQFPIAVPDPSVRKIVEAVDGRTAMREIFARLGLQTNFHTVNQARMKLTTPIFPHLKAVSASAQSNGDGHEEFDFAEVDTQKLAAAKRSKFTNIKPKAIKVSREV
jgi:2-polyprenyl-3-methyl-5-hydroxy-6-metoxy-1,4-benzoquinol methylase